MLVYIQVKEMGRREHEMAVASYMDFFGYRFSDDSTVESGTVEIDYRIKYDAPVVTATVGYEESEDGRHRYSVNDLGRKHRNSKAEQERVWELLRVARNYHRLFSQDTHGNRARDFGRR